MPPIFQNLEVASTLTGATIATLGSPSAALSLLPLTAVPASSFPRVFCYSKQSAGHQSIIADPSGLSIGTESHNREHEPGQNPPSSFVAGCPHAEEKVKELNKRHSRKPMTNKQKAAFSGYIGGFVGLFIGAIVWINCHECAKQRKADRNRPSRQWFGHYDQEHEVHRQRMTAEESRRQRELLDIEMDNWISTPGVPRPAYIDPYGFPEGSGIISDLPDADYLPRAHPSTSTNTEARAPDASDSPPGESPFADPTEPPQLDTEARLKEQNSFVSDD